VAAPNLGVGVNTLVQAYGIGPIRANTILLNWLEQLPGGEGTPSTQSYGRNLRSVFRLGCNIVVLNAKEEAWAGLAELPADKRRIDVWWWRDRTSRLMLLLAYLMTRSEEWSGTKIRVLAADVETEEDAEAEADYAATVEDLRNTLEEFRISAEPEVVVHTNVETVAEHSGNAALVFLPFRLRGNQLVGPFGGRVEDLLAPLPVTAIGLAAEDISLDAEPEEGKSAEIASALDAFAKAKKRLEKAQQEASEAHEYAAKMLKELREAAEADVGEAVLSDIEEASLEVMELADRAARRQAEAVARMEDAAKKAKAVGASPEEDIQDAEEKKEQAESDDKPESS
jgi:hypothetical protein